MTVPRLDLMGAILSLRLTQSLLTVLELPIQSVPFYSDSTDVLWRIRRFEEAGELLKCILDETAKPVRPKLYVAPRLS